MMTIIFQALEGLMHWVQSPVGVNGLFALIAVLDFAGVPGRTSAGLVALLHLGLVLL